MASIYADCEERARQKYKDGVPCTPPDIIFANAAGEVHDSETPKHFVGARLCDRFVIRKYIESGAFGRAQTCHGDVSSGTVPTFIDTSLPPVH